MNRKRPILCRAKTRPHGPRSSQRGLALMELMLITVPLSILSIVLASAIAATSTAKNRSMWKASLQAQQATREPCGGMPLYYMPTSSPKQSQFGEGRRLAAEIGLIGLPITLTNQRTERVVEPVAPFYFESAADRMFPSRSRAAENSATFVCNEPDHKSPSSAEALRRGYEMMLFGRAFAKSQQLY
ncbi:MAG: hypothetical protein RMK29_15585 [Myxococcales bacterium]|nr:hypothetical protein [Myxococcota bacterium]MDW8283137.1 hypothetical protein [Myxococcales bacterium]